MKVSKLIGVVLSLHVGIAVLIIQPGCNTTQPPTQTYQQDRTGIRSSVKGAYRTQDGLIPATRVDEGSNLDAAFNAGLEGGDFTPIEEFPEFDDVTTLEPIETTAPVVPVSGPSYTSYTVQKGDSLWAISKSQNVSLNELYAANGLNKNSVLKIGQVIQIPGEGGSATVTTVTADTYQPTSFNSATENYTVKGGDTLSKIAKQYGTSVRAIKAANNKSTDMIRVGEKLVIPVSGSGSSSAAPAPAPTVSTPAPAPVSTSSASGRTHTVKSGEYPATIARKYGMTSGELLALNGITDPRSLQIGQVLNVSASGSAANVDTRTETVTTTAAAPASVTTSFTPAPAAPIASDGPVAIRIVEADPLVEDEADIIDIDSQFEGAVEIPVIRLEE